MRIYPTIKSTLFDVSPSISDTLLVVSALSTMEKEEEKEAIVAVSLFFSLSILSMNGNELYHIADRVLFATRKIYGYQASTSLFIDRSGG